jgi:hypothetical protein
MEDVYVHQESSMTEQLASLAQQAVLSVTTLQITTAYSVRLATLNIHQTASASL